MIEENQKMTVSQIAEKMIARRVSKGFNEADSRTELANILARHSGDNLASALCYEAFATETLAYKFVKAWA